MEAAPAATGEAPAELAAASDPAAPARAEVAEGGAEAQSEQGGSAPAATAEPERAVAVVELAAVARLVAEGVARAGMVAAAA